MAGDEHGHVVAARAPPRPAPARGRPMAGPDPHRSPARRAAFSPTLPDLHLKNSSAQEHAHRGVAAHEDALQQRATLVGALFSAGQRPAGPQFARAASAPLGRRPDGRPRARSSRQGPGPGGGAKAWPMVTPGRARASRGSWPRRAPADRAAAGAGQARAVGRVGQAPAVLQALENALLGHVLQELLGRNARHWENTRCSGKALRPPRGPRPQAGWSAALARM